MATLSMYRQFPVDVTPDGDTGDATNRPVSLDIAEAFQLLHQAKSLSLRVRMVNFTVALTNDVPSPNNDFVSAWRFNGDVTKSDGFYQNAWRGGSPEADLTSEKQLACPRVFQMHDDSTIPGQVDPEGGNSNNSGGTMLGPFQAEYGSADIGQAINFTQALDSYQPYSLVIDLSASQTIHGSSNAGPFSPFIVFQAGVYNVTLTTTKEDPPSGAQWVEVGTLNLLGHPPVPMFCDIAPLLSWDSVVSVDISGTFDSYITVNESWGFS